ncbi:MAG: hypothetical protein ACRDKW_07290, partial [Actinomycetota bacterium]
TQRRIGTAHDTCLRESEVIATSIEALESAVAAGVCRRRPDGSVYIPVRSTGEADLTLLRRDGTSLVFSMLLGVYLTRAALYPGWQVMELTGEQWRAGRTAMYEVLTRIGREDLSATTEGVFFGMVQLGGRVMRSRSGTVVTADELLDRTAERVRGWEACPESLRDDAAARDRLGTALLKYHVLRYPRADGFSFDEEWMWTEATARLGAVLRTRTWAQTEGGPLDHPDGDRPEVRSLLLTLARHGASAGRSLARRDPAILVRYVDDVVAKAQVAARRGPVPPRARTAVGHVVDRSLALLGIDLEGPVGLLPEGRGARPGDGRRRQPATTGH